MSTKRKLLKLAISSLLLSSCSVTQLTQPDPNLLFSSSNPLRKTQPRVPLRDWIEPAVVYFANDSHEVTPGERDRLADFFDQFLTTEWQPPVITGHTDAIESEDYSIKLAQRRIENVKVELTRLGYPKDLMIEIAKGESQPIATNATVDGCQLNRRVEVELR